MRALTPYGLLGGLSVPAEKKLRSLGRPRVFGSGQLLFPFAPHDTYAVLITQGLVKLTANSTNDGPGVMTSIHGAGDLLGEEGALQKLCPDRKAPLEASDAEAITLMRVFARVIPNAELHMFFREYPEAVAAVALGLGDRLAEAESRLVSMGQDNADRRLARLLCDLERYGRPSPGELGGTTLPVVLSQAELASWIGASPGTVERVLRRWRDRGIVSTGYLTLTVHDLETLARIAGIRILRRAYVPVHLSRPNW